MDDLGLITGAEVRFHAVLEHCADQGQPLRMSPAGRTAEFEQAYRRACAVLDEDPHCLAYEVSNGVEEPEHYVVRMGFCRGPRAGVSPEPGLC